MHLLIICHRYISALRSINDLRQNEKKMLNENIFVLIRVRINSIIFIKLNNLIIKKI